MPIDKLNAPNTAANRMAGLRETTDANESDSKAGERATLRDVQRASEQLSSYMKSVGRTLEFKVDEGSGRTVVCVRDAETGELIRQIPGEEVLRLARSANTTSALVSITA